MLLVEPAGPEAELDAPVAHGVDGGDRDGERARQAERARGDQRAQADGGGVAGEPGQRDPGIGRAGQPRHVAHLEVVVGSEERAEAQLLGGAGDGEEVVVGGALLGLGEDAQFHDARRYRRAVAPVGSPDAL